jgi:hypothetical protein
MIAEVLWCKTNPGGDVFFNIAVSRDISAEIFVVLYFLLLYTSVLLELLFLAFITLVLAGWILSSTLHGV